MNICIMQAATLNKVKYTLVILLVLGIIIRSFHIYPGFFVVLFALGMYIPFSLFEYFSHNPRKLIHHLSLGLTLIWTMTAILWMLHVPYAGFFKYIAVISFAVYVSLDTLSGEEIKPDLQPDVKSNPGPLYSTVIDSNPAEKSTAWKGLGKYLFPVAAALVTLGFFLRYYHYPGGMLLLAGGLVTGIIWLLYDYIKP